MPLAPFLGGENRAIAASSLSGRKPFLLVWRRRLAIRASLRRVGDLAGLRKDPHQTRFDAMRAKLPDSAAR